MVYNVTLSLKVTVFSSTFTTQTTKERERSMQKKREYNCKISNGAQ